jgi:hypothetical protein
MSSLDQLQNAWSLIIDGSVDVEKWNSKASADAMDKYIVKQGNWSQVANIDPVDVAWLDQSSSSLFGMFVNEDCGMYTLAYGKTDRGKDKLRLDKDKHTVKIKFIKKLASTASEIQKKIIRSRAALIKAKNALRIDMDNYDKEGVVLEARDTINSILGPQTTVSDELVEEWKSLASFKQAAIEKIHCPVRYQGKYIAQTLQVDLGTHLQNVQDPSKPRSDAAWIDCFLRASGPEEDMKFVQFINIRADFPTGSNELTPRETSFKTGATDSLRLAQQLNR